jgi:hypothetical protein
MYWNDKVDHSPSLLEEIASVLKFIINNQRIYIMKIFFTSKFTIIFSVCQNETIPNITSGRCSAKRAERAQNAILTRVSIL